VAKRRANRVRSTAECPRCGNQMAYSSSICAECRMGASHDWATTTMLYNYRNPDDPLTEDKVKNIGTYAIAKIRRHIAALRETGDVGEDPLSASLDSLMGELNYG
jgi:predicted amidophosphoribosyltransferase